MKSTIPYVFYEGAVYYQFGEFSIAFAKGANNTYTAKFPDDPDSQLCAAAFSRFLMEQLDVLIQSKSFGGSWECYFCDEDCHNDYPKPTISEIAIPYSGLCKLYGR